MTIRLVSCMNVSFCSAVDNHDHKVVYCMNVSFYCKVNQHDHKVGFLYQLKLLLRRG